jgi:phosphoribosylaminoimidazolecarboxamide formyltransferase / IMP cyclohydrolase
MARTPTSRQPSTQTGGAVAAVPHSPTAAARPNLRVLWQAAAASRTAPDEYCGCRSLAEAGQQGVAAAKQHHGKEMSYNNYLDADAAYGAVCDYAGADSGPIGRHRKLARGHLCVAVHCSIVQPHCHSHDPASPGSRPLCHSLADPTCVVVKHTNPCGIASREDLKEAYRLAVRADPISAFGGIVAFNR